MRLRLTIMLLILLATAFVALTTARSGQPPPMLRGWETNLSKRAIDLDELRAGGPGKDGIPALTDPRFESIQEARAWLADEEPVISLAVEDEARAYPLQVLIWHEIANDRIAGRPVAVTFCPLCYSAIVFDRTVEGRELVFGVSGMLRHSDLVMYDRQTESLWQQLTGRALVGDMTGSTLNRLPAQIISFGQFALAYRDGLVLSRETGYNRAYGRNPYAGYDDISGRPWMAPEAGDDRLPPMEKVVAVTIGDADRAYPHSLTRERRVISDQIEGQPIVIFHAEGAVSALDRQRVAASRQIGSTGVFDPRVEGRALTFDYAEGRFKDRQSGSTWDITGRALSGPLQGSRLKPIVHGDYFAFAWFAFKPETEVYGQTAR
jgi:hypothetical protein